jgi:hypothetical protein
MYTIVRALHVLILIDISIQRDHDTLMINLRQDIALLWLQML